MFLVRLTILVQRSQEFLVTFFIYQRLLSTYHCYTTTMNEEMYVIKREEFENHPLLSRLLELHDIPKELYIIGKLPEVTIDLYGRATPRILTVVGSRKHTSYGKHVVEKLLESLEGQDIVILSGLALGIDGLAHKEALRNKIVTIAIPGSGLGEKTLYPETHRYLAQEIVEQGGTLISELAPDVSAAPWTFPARNRIMAALSDALLVIEAENKSGTLITGRLALELGRDIGAVPGEIFSPTSIGTNMLIHEGAHSISSVDDLFSLLHLSKQETEPVKHTYTPSEQKIITLIREPIEKDLLLVTSELSLEEFLTAFSSLEIRGHVEETFGEVRRLV